MKYNITFFRGTCVALVLGSLLLSGCGPAALPVVKISGKVTFEGKPLDGAMVTFAATEPEGRNASGVTDANGEFSVMTLGATKQGCLPGSYRVMIGKYIGVDARGNPLPVSKEPEPVSLESGWSSGVEPDESAPAFARLKSVIPERYDNAETSGLSAEVVKRSKNHFVFELTN